MRRDLVEGYLFEVTKSLPRRDRTSVYERLELEINDEIERTKRGPIETREEVLKVLEGFGNPADIAARYSNYKKRGLVPQPHYNHYLRNKWLAFIVGLLVIGGAYGFNLFYLNSLNLGVNTGLEILSQVGKWFLVVYITYTLGYSWVSGNRLPGWNRFSKSIKSEPSKSSRISAFESNFQVIISAILFTGIALVGGLFGLNLTDLTLYNTLLPVFALVLVAYFLSIINVAYKEIDKRYTLAVLATTILSNLAIIGLAYILFVANDSLGQNFRIWLSGVLPASNLMATLVNNAGLVVFLIVTLFALIDLISTAFGYHSNTKDSVEPIYKDMRDKEDIPVEKAQEEVLYPSEGLDTPETEEGVVVETAQADTLYPSEGLDTPETEEEVLVERNPNLVDTNPPDLINQSQGMNWEDDDQFITQKIDGEEIKRELNKANPSSKED